MRQEEINFETGEIIEPKLNEVIIKTTVRPNGTLRIQQDFSNCPTLAEQHTAHLTNLNYLIAKYKPDELAAYMAARESHRQEIKGHDFSTEPSLQEAKNIIYRSRQEFNELPEEIRNNFKNHLEFLKFIDNPANAEKMIKLGILTPKQIEKIQIPSETTDSNANTNDEPVEEATAKEKKSSSSKKADRL